MTRLTAAIAAAFLTAALLGCSTVAGVGKDVKATGQAIENAADKPAQKKSSSY